MLCARNQCSLTLRRALLMNAVIWNRTDLVSLGSDRFKRERYYAR